MAYEIPDFTYTLPASADLSASQYLFVVATSGQAAVAGAGVVAAGVLQNDPGAAGQPATIMATGVSKVVAGAAVTAGARVMSNASGKAVAATGTNFVTGMALTAAGAADEVISVYVNPMGHFALV